MAERKMLNIVTTIVTTLKGDTDWDKAMDVTMRNLNTTYNKTTGSTPFECIFEDARLVHATIDENETEVETREEHNRNIRERVEQHNERTKRRYDSTRFDQKYDIGDVVVVRRLPTADGRPTKCQRIFKGPYVIVETLPSDVYFPA